MLKKLSDMFFGTYEPEREEDTKETPTSYLDFTPQKQNRNKGQIVNINATAQLEVMVLNLKTYEDANDVADQLKARKAAVINLEAMDKDSARKIVDFTSGVVYALDGNIQKVASGTFLITPFNVPITGAVKDELKSKGIFSWGI